MPSEYIYQQGGLSIWISAFNFQIYADISASGVTDLRNHRKQQVKKCGSNNHRICNQILHQFPLPPLHINRVNHIFLLKRLVLVL